MSNKQDVAIMVGFVLLVIASIVWTVGYYWFIPCDVLDALPAKDVPGRCFR